MVEMNEDDNKSLLARRREARNRKILENANRRIQKITNSTDASEIITPIYENVMPPKVTEEIVSNSNGEQLNDVKECFMNQWNNLPEQNTKDTAILPVQQLLNYKSFVLIVLSLIVAVLYRFQLNHIYFENVLAPYFSVQIVHLISRATSSTSSSSSILTAALALFGIKSTALSVATHFLGFALEALTDFCLYMFILIIFTSIG